MRACLLVISAFTALALVCAGCGGASSQTRLAGGEAYGGELPGLAQLDAMDGAGVTRTGSEATLNLLSSAPFDQAETGVTYNPGYLYLDSSVESPSWAIFRIGGLGTEGDAYPLSVEINNSAVCWVGVANYSRGTWQFTKVVWGGECLLEGGAGLVSEGGNCYIAVLAHDTIPDVYALTAKLNNAPAGSPTAQLNLLGMAVTEWNTSFDATGSDKGGGEFTELIYEFDGGSPQTVAAPEDVAEHMFETTGTHTVKLTVRNDLGLEHFVMQEIEVGDPNRDLLVVYNSDILEDLDLADYYMSPRTGRGIDPQHKLGLPLGAYSATIARADYVAEIRDPIKQFIGDYPMIGGKLKYLLLLNGVPFKIPGADGGNHDQSTNTSVDSELCLLNSGGAEGDGGYRLEGAVWSESAYHAWNGNGFYLAGDVDFAPGAFTTTDLDGVHWPLDYLVGRLAAYTYDNAKQLVDRSLAAGSAMDGWVIFDTKPGSQIYETMFDPVWPMSDDSWDSGFELLTAAGMNVVGDETADKLYADWPGNPPEFTNNIMAYCSWGVHSGWGKLYILNDLGYNYVPGACFMSYESFNGTTMRCSDPFDADQHPSQGQIADFLLMGGTCAIGNVYEPWTDGVGDERWVFDRYLNHGDRWIEAAYKGLPMLSWQEIVVGDPLCRVR